MKGTFAACFVSLALLMDHTLARAVPVWISAFDNTSRLPSGLIDQRINSQILSLPILGLRFYRVDGAGSYVSMAPYLGLGRTLGDHFNQPWAPVGYETDKYKFLSVNTGSRLTTIYISDDDDIVNPLGGPYIRQTEYPGTPAGIVTSGYTTAFFWLDHGNASYGTGTDYHSLVYRLDILAILPASSLPTVNCSAPLILECTNGAAVGILQAVVSDTNGNPLEVIWTVDGTPYQTNNVPSGGNTTQSNLTFTANFGSGGHEVVVTASNGQTNGACSTTVTVSDSTPPQLATIVATPQSLWPPNQRMVPVQLIVDAVDNCEASPIVRITEVRSNEPQNPFASDWEITGPLSVNLRAKRSGKSGGRTYTIVVECEDANGNVSSASVNVTVPHDHR